MVNLFLSKEEIQNLLGERKRILVTGGAGFIGSALIRRLLFSSKAIIFNVDKLNYASDLSSIKILSKQIINFDERYKFINLDISDYEKTLEIMEFYKPDLIFHLAAESHVDNSINEPKEFLKSNIIGTFNLLESVRILLKSYSPAKKNIFRFHHISTDEVFGEILDNSKFEENTRYDPRSPYSASKASSDHLVKAWFHTYGIPIIMTNCSNNYGPWQFPEKLIPLVVNNALNSTLSRTVNTSLTTFFVLLIIFIFGGEVIRGFMFALMVGVLVGTYSSLFVASPIMLDTLKRKSVK